MSTTTVKITPELRNDIRDAISKMRLTKNLLDFELDELRTLSGLAELCKRSTSGEIRMTGDDAKVLAAWL